MLRPQYFYNIFTKNHRWLVIISSNLNLTLGLLFCPTIITSNNLPFRICCKNIIDISFLFFKNDIPYPSVHANKKYGAINILLLGPFSYLMGGPIGLSIHLYTLGTQFEGTNLKRVWHCYWQTWAHSPSNNFFLKKNW